MFSKGRCTKTVARCACLTQMQLAVDEVALERAKACEQQGGRADEFRRIASDPDRVPIEAPRALRSNSDLGSGARRSLLPHSHC